MEFKGSNIFLNIPINIARDPVLLDKTPKGILLMGEIVSMLNVTGKFFMSNAEMAKRLRVSQSTVKNYLDLLEERGYIVRKIIYKENSKQIVGREITLGQSAVLGWGNALTEGRSIAKPRVGQPTDHKKNSIREQYKRTDKDIGQAEPDDIPYKEIIDYLNKKTGRRFPATAKRNREPIHARWREGYRLEDFKRVIDNKCFSWANDPKMSAYLRPTTLFSPKFSDYLNENNIPANATPYDLKDFENQKLPQDDDLPF
ncbi:conserved phage C-terminal domain-containing protein [Lactobacillus johnsonii]|uniref:conserved phage C-terminal domain-containing protein n=1 Tax=Lactobacillus johnsonii TaxID=33959 RepID=UPI00178092B9|nr:conserved phage C-terminal domain-containing protein [Lactobacillus johnsonii]QXL48201.1 conserved phage C-terminal domain-containing protein [Lactobacillus johnsonii]